MNRGARERVQARLDGITWLGSFILILVIVKMTFPDLEAQSIILLGVSGASTVTLLSRKD